MNKYFFEIEPHFGYTFRRDISCKDRPIKSQLILKNTNSENFEFTRALGFEYKMSELYQIFIWFYRK